MLQLILHLIGDYITQSDWMAQGKIQRSLPALAHATVYTIPFLIITRRPLPLFVIWSTHFLIDRFRLAKYVVYAKNFLAPPSAYMAPVYLGREGEPEMFDAPPHHHEISEKYSWRNCRATGYPKELDPFMAVWLMIIADNTMHLTINYFSLRWL